MSITEQATQQEPEKGSPSANKKTRKMERLSKENQQHQGEAWKKKFQNPGIDSSSHSNPPRLPGRSRTQKDIKLFAGTAMELTKSNSNSSCSSVEVEDGEQQQQQPRVNHEHDCTTPQESSVKAIVVGGGNPIQSLNNAKAAEQAPRLPGRKVTPKVTVRPLVEVQNAEVVSEPSIVDEDENDDSFPMEERRKSEPPKLPGRRPSKSTPSTMEKVYEDFRDKFARRFSIPKRLSNGVTISLSQAPKIPGRRPSHKRHASNTEKLDEAAEEVLSETNVVVIPKWSEEYDDSSIGTLDGEFNDEDNQQSSLIRQWVANLEENPSDDEEEDEDDEEEVVLFDLDKSVEDTLQDSQQSFHLYIRRDSFGSNISSLSMGTAKCESDMAVAAAVVASSMNSSSGRKFSKRFGQKRFSNSMRESGEKRVGKPSMPRRQQSTGNTYFTLSEATSTKETSTSERNSEEDITASAPTSVTPDTECPQIPLPQIPIRKVSLVPSGGTLSLADQVEKIKVACTE